MTDDVIDDLPIAVWSGSFTVFGVELKCHRLSDGRAIIESKSIEQFLSGMDPKADPADLEDFTAWRDAPSPFEMGATFGACGDWSSDAPTEPGHYLFVCDENSGTIEELVVFQRDDGQLMVECPDLGVLGVAAYHDGLCNPMWKGPRP